MIVWAENCAGRNESARSRSHARVTRAALVNSARGHSTHTAAASARAPSESETGGLPRLGASCYPRAQHRVRARELGPRTPTTAQLAADPAHPFSTLDVCGDGTHTHMHRHGIRSGCERRAPEAAVFASPRTGMQGSRARSRLLSGYGRRTGVGKATGKRGCAHIRAPQPKTSGMGMGWGLKYKSAFGRQKRKAHVGMRLELVALGIAGGGGADLTHLAANMGRNPKGPRWCRGDELEADLAAGTKRVLFTLLSAFRAEVGYWAVDGVHHEGKGGQRDSQKTYQGYKPQPVRGSLTRKLHILDKGLTTGTAWARLNIGSEATLGFYFTKG
ncbi:hypothetical protein C8F04DRAFT_1203386 [Mycena alexandri]|uniref:Uncharacterized protein n=1 Tax=Mycena alexandri TaxID=1745969 RepID=A0AAD6WLY3_9AGAR|nr:hypothetical protein C8F04DRAFT_1203386 [Mycena alexandri]